MISGDELLLGLKYASPKENGFGPAKNITTRTNAMTIKIKYLRVDINLSLTKNYLKTKLEKIWEQDVPTQAVQEYL